LKQYKYQLCVDSATKNCEKGKNKVNCPCCTFPKNTKGDVKVIVDDPRVEDPGVKGGITVKPEVIVTEWKEKCKTPDCSDDELSATVSFTITVNSDNSSLTLPLLKFTNNIPCKLKPESGKPK
jgi:hypothetical protein